MADEKPLGLLTRCLGAIPDLLTAGFFVTVWIAPFRFGESSAQWHVDHAR